MDLLRTALAFSVGGLVTVFVFVRVRQAEERGQFQWQTEHSLRASALDLFLNRATLCDNVTYNVFEYAYGDSLREQLKDGMAAKYVPQPSRAGRGNPVVFPGRYCDAEPHRCIVRGAQGHQGGA